MNWDITKEQYEKLPFRHQVAYMEQQMYSRGRRPVLWDENDANSVLIKLVADRALSLDKVDHKFLERAEKWAKKYNVDIEPNVNCRCCGPDIEKYL